ncbi:MAG: hypothetical protein JSV65_17185 [Armatimonadota bacterium]|nr:MAG: hypothetical protein JSV65_17185 [Armatimonadota bacterium]
MSEDELRAVADRFAEAKILVLGELWLEQVLRGAAAPGANGILRVRDPERIMRAGGAAGVACCAAALGAAVWAAGVVGQDAQAGELLRALGAARVDPFAIASDPDHGTGEKLILNVEGAQAEPQGAVEIVLSPAAPLAGAPAQEMLDHVEAIAAGAGAIVMALYDSIPEQTVLERLTRSARANGKPVVAGLGCTLPPGCGGLAKAALPPCDMLAVAPAERAGDAEAEGVPVQALLAEGRHAAVVIVAADGRAAVHTGNAPEGEVIEASPIQRSPAWEQFMAGLAVAAALGADAATSARMGAAAAAAAARGGGVVSPDALSREPGM